MASIVLEILRQFDSTIWQTAPPLSAPGSTVLLTWTVTPPPADAGIPESVARVFAEALCSIGSVIYAGDDLYREFRLTQKVSIKKGLQSLNLALFCATSAPQLLPAFSDGTHDWSMNAQWLMVTDSSQTVKGIAPIAKQLYELWTLPHQWPADLLIIVQAAVDGDGAACHSASKNEEGRFVQALYRSAQQFGMELRVEPTL